MKKNLFFLFMFVFILSACSNVSENRNGNNNTNNYENNKAINQINEDNQDIENELEKGKENGLIEEANSQQITKEESDEDKESQTNEDEKDNKEETKNEQISKENSNSENEAESEQYSNIYKSEFDNVSGFTTVDNDYVIGNWVVEDGVLKQTKLPTDWFEANITFDETKTGENYILETDAKLASGTSWVGIHIIKEDVNHGIVDSGYIVFMSQDGVVSMVDATDGNNETLAAGTVEINEAAEFNRIKIIADKNYITVLVNDIAAFEYDNSLKGDNYSVDGYVGLVSGNGKVEFDNFSLKITEGLSEKLYNKKNYLEILEKTNISTIVDTEVKSYDNNDYEYKTYYISSSLGNDSNLGTKDKPWKTLKNLNNKSFEPGDRILFKAGDTFSGGINIYGSGTKSKPIIISSYGDGKKPIFDIGDTTYGVGIKVNNGSNWIINNISFKNGKLGIYLRYDTFDNEKIEIASCDFYNFQEGGYKGDIYDSWATVNERFAQHNNEYSFSAGIMLGGKIDPNNYIGTVLDEYTIKDCDFDYVDAGIINNFYFTMFAYDRIKNIYFDDITINRLLSTGLALNSVTNGVVRNFRMLSGSNDIYVPFGPTALITHGCDSIVMENFIVLGMKRKDDSDACGVDFEYSKNMTFRNAIIGGNASQALLLLDTPPWVGEGKHVSGHNENMTIENLVIFNNLIDQYQREDLVLEYDMYSRNPNNSGTINKFVAFYNPEVSINVFSPNWSLFEKNDIAIYEQSKFPGLDEIARLMGLENLLE